MLAIIGKGGFGREVYAWVKNSQHPSQYVEYYVTSEYEGKQIKDIPKRVASVIAIGEPKKRKEVSKLYNWYTNVIHKTTIIGENVNYGEGCIFSPYSVVTVDCRIGNHLHMNLHTDIGHDCTIGDFVTMSPGSRISGNCKIGNCVYIGSNAVIREGVTICDNVTIGAGAIVLNDITESGTYVGVPAKQIIKNAI